MTKMNKTTIVETREELGAVPVRTEDNGMVRAKSSFGKTLYYVDTSRARLSKAPPQMKALIEFMIHEKITSPENAKQGSMIGAAAVATGAVKTNKLTGPVIFAYYARRMELEQGLVLLKVIHARTGKVMA